MSKKQSNPSVPNDKGNICTISTKEKIGLTGPVHQMKKARIFIRCLWLTTFLIYSKFGGSLLHW